MRLSYIYGCVPFLLLSFGCGVGPVAGEELAFMAQTRAFYVAPQEIGNGRGTSQATAADFRNMNVWSVVQQAVQKAPVTVNFLDGTYAISSDENKKMPGLLLAGFGHKDHPLVLQGMSKNGVVFTRLASDSMEGKKGPGFLEITRSRNMIVRNLHFTGKQPISYATDFNHDQVILIEGCSWIDLPGVEFGATGTSAPSTDYVTYTNCVFKRVGSGAHAHMSYNANGSKHIRFVHCHFEDCSGDYVRFRSGADFGVVVGCTFKSTGVYRRINMPFVTVPLFNDDDPSKKGDTGRYEYFGSHFLIANNTFSYDNDNSHGNRVALLFHHSGFDPPGRNHLLTSEEGQLLAKGSVAEKRVLMLRNLGIDAEQVHFFNNRFIGTDLKVAYRSGAAYGATTKGWSGIVDIADTVNVSKVIEDSDDALKFFN